MLNIAKQTGNIIFEYSSTQKCSSENMINASSSHQLTRAENYIAHCIEIISNESCDINILTMYLIDERVRIQYGKYGRL